MQFPNDHEMTRRDALKAGSAGVAVTMATSLAAGQVPTEAQPVATDPVNVLKVSFTVNGAVRELELDLRTTLLDARREHLHLTGSKKGCDHGQCGACTVIVNGRRILSCLALAVMHDGDGITTIEGLGTPEDMHPIQASFVNMTAFSAAIARPDKFAQPSP